jgi:predicted Zn-dependent protease
MMNTWTKIRRNSIWVLVLSATLLQGCATNPVTGQKELTLVSESMELQAGQKQYAPSRQMQGGDYRLDPELSRYVNRVGQRLAAVSDRKLPYEFVVLNNSTPNAWALPGGKIAVNRGLLLELNNEAELAAVLGHEIVHSAARHGAKSMEKGMLLQGAVLATALGTRDSRYSNLAVGGALIGANLINQRYSRDAEREADLYGMRYLVRAGYDPQAAVGLQETFLRLSKNKRQDWLSGLFASHPPSAERVANNRETARKLPPGGELGEQRYRQATARLRKTQPAYEAYDEGRKALSKGQVNKAQAQVAKAMRIEPREALFYGLRGDVRAKQKNYRRALADFDRAVQLDSGFFYHYLRRGVIRQKLNDTQGARGDLKKSISLLPTSNAYYALGRLELDGGNRYQAKEYFSKAAGSQSEAGKAAAVDLARLDLPENPGRYLRAGLSLGQDGQIYVTIENTSPLPVRNIRYEIGPMNRSGGLSGGSSRSVRGTLPAGKSVRVGSGIGGLTNSKQLRKFGLRFTRADVAG